MKNLNFGILGLKQNRISDPFIYFEIINYKKLLIFLFYTRKYHDSLEFKELYNDVILKRIKNLKLKKSLFEKSYSYILVLERREKLNQISYE